MTNGHIPVLQTEVLTALNLKPNQNIVDCTLGAGGHAKAILQQIGPHGHLLGLDQDPTAIVLATERLAPYVNQVTVVNINFDQLSQAIISPPYSTSQPFGPIHGILADLGVSSMQLDQPERGFSFQQSGPLDMRLGPDILESAADLINHLAEEDLANIIYRYGEERQSRRIARAIVQARPLHTTLDLAEVVLKATTGSRRSSGRTGRRHRGAKIHPATRTFQAIRIAVNDELGALERLLPQAINLLAPGGRLAIISFHSLEDRIVKHFFRQQAGLNTNTEAPSLRLERKPDPTIKIITKKPIVAVDPEKSTNPRARSAKLRVVEKI